MSSRFYDNRTTQSNEFYQSSRTEPDMRVEFNNFLDGRWPEMAKAQPALLRKMRRDSNGNLTECSCVDILTHEPDRDSFCPICHGEGYIWDEIWIDTYAYELGSDIGKAIREEQIKPGLMNVPLMIFYMRSSVDVTKADKVVEVIRGEDGKPVEPMKREQLYRITALIDLRSDSGKLDYWKVDCYQEERKFLNGK